MLTTSCFERVGRMLGWPPSPERFSPPLPPCPPSLSSETDDGMVDAMEGRWGAQSVSEDASCPFRAIVLADDGERVNSRSSTRNDNFARDKATPITEFDGGRLLWWTGRAGDVSADVADLRAIRLWARRWRRRSATLSQCCDCDAGYGATRRLRSPNSAAGWEVDG